MLKASRIRRLFHRVGARRPEPRSDTLEHYSHAGQLNDEANRLAMRYDREGRLEDLTQAIEYSQEAIDLIPTGNPNRAGYLNNLSKHLSTRYKREGRLEDFAQAIEYSQEAVDLPPAGNPSRALYLNNLSFLLSTQYRRGGPLQNLIQAIEYSQEAVNLTPTSDPDRAMFLSNLGYYLSIRYEREERPEDLTQAIKYSQEAVSLIPTGNFGRAGNLSNLSTHLSLRYRREGRLEDLNQAIEYTQEAIDLTPTGNPDRAGQLNNISSYLGTRYKEEGRLEDLNQAIEYSQAAIDLTPTGNPNRAGRLNNLSCNLGTRYEKEGRLEDLNQAIEHSQAAVDLTATGSPDQASHLNTLSKYLSTRYDTEGRLEDLTQAIEYSQEAVKLIPAGNPSRALYLNNLSTHLNTRYEREGRLEDLTQAIEYNQEAVDLVYTGNPDRTIFLSNLGGNLSTRYNREGRLEDLTQAIKYSQEAVSLTPTGNFGRAGNLNNLSKHLSTRYRREGRLEDLSQAIECSQEAVSLTPAGDNRATCLFNLSEQLGIRYERKWRLEDLTQAIKYGQEAVVLTPVGNPDRAGWLNNLSNHLSTLYDKKGGLEHLTQAIECSQEAVNLTPTGNPGRAGRLVNLSVRLSTRYQGEREKRPKDLIQAIEHCRNATKCVNSPLSVRVRACLNAVEYLALLENWQDARAMLAWGLGNLPLLVSNLSSKFDQENMMKSISGLAAIGCAVLLECSDNGYEAIRVLELSRGTINRLTTNSRTELSMLYRTHEDLAKQFEDLRSLINAPITDKEDLDKSTLSKESAMSRLHDLVDLIHTKEGFKDFQDLPSKVKLPETSSNHGTVLLNTTDFRTDALLIHGDQRIQVLSLDKSIFPLSRFYYDRICDRFGYNKHRDWKTSNEDMRDFLIWLWNKVVDPILLAFNFEPSEILSASKPAGNSVDTPNVTQPRYANGSEILDPEKLTIYRKLMKQQPNITSSSSSAGPFQARSAGATRNGIPRFPRIHWIGVGHLCSFPFHAAGYGSQGCLKNTMSCAISSYASTLTAQAYAKQKPVTLEPSSSGLLLIAMPKTPGQSDLPGVEREAEIIQDTLQGLMAIRLHKLQPVDVILKDLPFYNSVHFACHGYADPQSPFQSGLLLCGNEPEKGFNKNTRNSMLTVETISSINTQHSLLAFLSACYTAENASSVLMDEGIHLAGGFQLAGYPHVITSLWEADDALSVAIAEKFYRIVFAESEIAGHDKIAYALHDAVLAAQQICEDPLSWATTIHFGP